MLEHLNASHVSFSCVDVNRVASCIGREHTNDRQLGTGNMRVSIRWQSLFDDRNCQGSACCWVGKCFSCMQPSWKSTATPNNTSLLTLEPPIKLAGNTQFRVQSTTVINVDAEMHESRYSTFQFVDVHSLWSVLKI